MSVAQDSVTSPSPRVASSPVGGSGVSLGRISTLVTAKALERSVSGSDGLVGSLPNSAIVRSPTDQAA